LTDESIEEALNNISELLLQKNIIVDFSREDDSRTQYQFITDELFDQKNDLMLPGMITHFNYEAFHPDHKLDTEAITSEFLSG